MGIMRGPILIPVWIGMEANLDQVAFAIVMGEMVQQFGTIPANRAYSRWCRTEPHGREAFKHAIASSAILSMAICLAACGALLAVWQLDLLPAQAQDLGIQLQALLFFSLVPSFLYLRYFAWSRNILAVWISNLTLLILISCSAAICFIPVSVWFAVLAMLLLLGCLFLAGKLRAYS